MPCVGAPVSQDALRPALGRSVVWQVAFRLLRRAKGGCLPSPQREALTHFTRPLRVLKHADARRDVQSIVVLFASSATLSDACLSARPKGRSGRSELCVVISRQVPTCLRNHALIADRPDRQRECEMGYRFPKSPGHPTTRPFGFAALLGWTGVAGEVVIKLVASLLRHPMTLFPVSPALLARVNGTAVRARCTAADGPHAERGSHQGY